MMCVFVVFLASLGAGGCFALGVLGGSVNERRSCRAAGPETRQGAGQGYDESRPARHRSLGREEVDGDRRGAANEGWVSGWDALLTSSMYICLLRHLLPSVGVAGPSLLGHALNRCRPQARVGIRSL
jgi:hypothetical protein